MGDARRAPTIAVDVNGADDPRAAAEGALSTGVDVIVFGPAAKLDGLDVVDAPVSIAKASDPARAARATPDASIVQAARAVADGRADALVAGGSTGTALAAGLFNIKRAKGIHRPALALPLPIPGAPVTLLDVGANEVCRPEHLVQFAYMGAALARSVLGVPAPRVGLLSNGTEPTKGREEVIEAHERLRDMEGFVGNVEGFAITEGVADVIVTDGFTGNVTLKVLEATSQAMIDFVRRAATSTTRAKLGGALLRPALRGLRSEIDPEAQGGAYLLGLRRLAVVPHGSFSAEGWAEAVRRAALGVQEELVARTHTALEGAGALRRVPASDAATSFPAR
ncbi:MAG TPA: phosphate acyltransferase PlsX [Solirubrobacteraceae bacterium]|nr:phosphate acyltransferase PlsX [Solirubrobacteraceae bacterium]